MLAELDEVVGHLQPVTMTHKALLPYCSAAIIEFQRLANILPFNLIHKTEMETELAGFRIPLGTLVLPQLSSVLSSSKHFEQPKECRPERFLESDGKTTNKVG
jgi:cytochrome P450